MRHCGNCGPLRFVLPLETGLAASGGRQALRLRCERGTVSPEDLTGRLGSEWIDRLTLPKISG